MVIEISTDLFYNLKYLLIFANSIILLFAAIVWHELGHMLFFKLEKKRNVRVFINNLDFEIGTNSDYDTLKEKDYPILMLSGIVIGFLPLIILASINSFYMFVAIGYLYGCRSDLKELKIEELD